MATSAPGECSVADGSIGEPFPASTSQPNLTHLVGARRTSLFVRVFAVNALLLGATTAIIAFTPAYVPFPNSVEKGLLLATGLTAVLLANALLVRATLTPLKRLERLMREIDLLQPGQRLPLEGPAEIAELAQSFNDMLARLEDERQQSSGRALIAQEAERQRVARELHDQIGQSLTAVLLGLDDMGAHAPSELRFRVEEVQEIARTSLDEVRAVARRLRPDVLEDLGLASALAAQTAQFTELTGIPVRRRIEMPLPALSPAAELAIYRVVQESFTNVARHAAAQSVDLTVVRAEDALVVSVADDGKGMGPGPTGEGGGIRGMRERALLVNGRLDVRSANGTGVAITLTVPLLSEA